MIAFLKNLFTRKREIQFLERQLSEVRTERDNWKSQYKSLSGRFDNLSNAKEDSKVTTVLDRSIYEAKIVSQLGNTIITSQDTPSSTGFKMGIQHALRVVEKEVVV